MSGMKILKAISISVLIFSVLFFCLSELIEYLESNVSNFMVILPWVNVVVCLLYMITGLFGSAYAGRNYIFVGLSTGLFSAMAASLIFGVGVGIEGFAATLVLGVLLGGIGGAFCKLAMRLRSAPSNKKLQSDR